MDKREPKPKKDLLRVWLRGRSHHPSDIKRALAFYKARVEANDDPTDAEVEEVAEQGHSEACGAAIPRPVVVEKTVVNKVHETIVHKISMKWAFFGSFLGSSVALASAAVLLWWLRSMGII